MSSLVFPTLQGLAWDVMRTPIWNTLTKKSASQREYRARVVSYPRYRYQLTYEFLRERQGKTELQQLIGLFNRCGGSFDTFLFADPDDSAVTDQVIGIGDGSSTQFQLVRTFGGFVEPVFAPNGAQTIKLNGISLGSGYSIDANGLVTFSGAPSSGVTITWSGAYYWRCRFEQDAIDFNKFMQQLWEAKKVTFLTCKP